MGGIWSKWTSPDGAELESCCVLTTKPNDLIKPLHHRMPVIVPNGYEEQWTEQVKDADELKGLSPIMMGWSPNGWLVEDIKEKRNGSNESIFNETLTNLKVILMEKSYWLINSNKTEVKRFIKNDKCIDGVFEYMFIDTGKIVGVLGKEHPLMTNTVSVDIDLAREIYERLLSQGWRKTEEIWKKK